jgi:RNA polymerase sigma-70 factor (ECF subfamily)
MPRLFHVLARGVRGSVLPMPASATDDGLAAFVSVRRRLFGITRRMLGSSVEAEDILQDVWMRWQTTDRSVVQNPPAFLVTMTTRLAINHQKSAPSRRESYVGPELFERLDAGTDPQLEAERTEALTCAVLLLFETLSPKERAAYMLREAFGCPYAEIAGLLHSSEPNARKLVSRARVHLCEARRTPVGQAD